MKRVFYKEPSVTALELFNWICEVNQSGLLNLLWVPHYHQSNINLIVIKQFLTLVHDGCLWLSTPIPITYTLIHRITLLPHSGLNLAKEFGRKMSEHDLTEKMKVKFKLVNKLCGYSITSIANPTVKIVTQILARKVMRKFYMDEVLTLVISLVSQCTEGVKFNWVRYLCSEFLVNY